MSVVAAIRRMLAKGMSVEDALDVAEAFEETQPTIDARSTSAKRQARYRQRKRNASVTPVTPLARVEDNLLPKNLESKSIYTDCVTEKGDGFAEFMTASPRRPDGAGSPRENRRAYAAAIAAGATPEGLHATVRDYAGERAAAVAKDPQQAKYTLKISSWLDRELWRRPLIALASNSAVDNFVPVKRSDPRWEALEARYRQENGRGPPLHDHWSYPRAWVSK